MAGRLDGKVALISGAARGMGESHARYFVAEGAQVVLGDLLDEEGGKLAAELGDAAIYTHLDVTDEASWQAAVALAQERFGRLDVLINNAGILRFAPLELTELEEFESVVKVNQTGTFLGMKTAIPALRAAGGGSIVNISSIAGMHGIPGVTSYAASKYAVRGMTKVAALELGEAGIRVNSVHPGGVNTPMVQRPAEEDGRLEDMDNPRFHQQPIARIGRPQEISELVLWLASDASSYCTGSEFVVDGGATAGRLEQPVDD
ncbi:MAG: glucose 1-dehydrogenase [Myxococcota bacterium]|nr:glucose 1-dehydrogenase [Myxococcota bacterium]